MLVIFCCRLFSSSSSHSGGLNHSACIYLIDLLFLTIELLLILKVWSITSYQYLGKHTGHLEPVSCMVMDANFLFSGSEDKTIRIWDALPACPVGTKLSSNPFQGGTLLKTLEGHKGTITGLDVLASSGHLVSCSIEGSIMVWDYITGDIILQHKHKEELLCMALRYDVDEIITGTRQGNILRFPAGEPVNPKLDSQHPSISI